MPISLSHIKLVTSPLRVQGLDRTRRERELLPAREAAAILRPAAALVAGKGGPVGGRAPLSLCKKDATTLLALLRRRP